MTSGFPADRFLPADLWSRLMEARRDSPDRSLLTARGRKRRKALAADGKLNVLAADHTARRVTAIPGNPVGIANRRELLARIARVLMSDVVDGVMGTMDVLEDILLLDSLTRDAAGASLVANKLLIVSLNRGGLAGTAWEMNDPVTGPSPDICEQWRFDGAKLLLRLCDEEPDSLATMYECAQAITEMNLLGLPTFLEPLPVVKTESGYKVVKTAEALAKIVGVASALGDTSRFLWLKLPYCEDYQIVAAATSLPILLLGGEATGDGGFLDQLAAGLAAGENVRGALVGRNVLYPGADDPLAVAEAAGGMIHNGLSIQEARAGMEAQRGAGLDRLGGAA